eukprot:scaffold34498_cov23-Cyclotella_meneghiniana.AAC.3
MEASRWRLLGEAWLDDKYHGIDGTFGVGVGVSLPASRALVTSHVRPAGDASESPPVSKHLAVAPIDASSMSWYALTSYWENQRNDCELMSWLDFVNLPDERIIRLFTQKLINYYKGWA